MEKRREFTTVSIPKHLGEKANKFIRRTGFTSLSSFVEYLLREIVTEEARKEPRKNLKEIEGVEDKLRKLGYM
jgi:metal-responsive CopG/Arc/MetJ family transcriptional regulator